MANTKAKTAETNPFMNVEKMQEMFKVPGFDKFFEQANQPIETMMTAQQKNVDALVEANKVAVAGYQELYGRLANLFEESLAQAKDRMSEIQGQEMSADAAAKNVEVMESAFEKALADTRELSEMAQKANAGAFDVIKARIEEAMAEFKKAADNAA